MKLSSTAHEVTLDMPSPMFRRGRLDHFALLAPSEEAFRELRRRIEAEGAADGDVRDTGRLDHGHAGLTITTTRGTVELQSISPT